MLSFLLLLTCLSSQATACSSCTVPSITGILNDLQLRAHITAVASTLNPPCTIDFVDATILVNRVTLDLVLHYPRALTAAEKIAHQIALRAAVIVKLSVLGIIDAAISLDVFVGVSSPYRCPIHVLAAPTVGNIMTSILTKALDVRVAIVADFLLVLPTGIVNCGEPLRVGAAVQLNINLSYLRALTAIEINAHALKIKALIAARIQPDLSKITVVFTKRFSLLGLTNVYDAVCTIAGENDETAPKLLDSIVGALVPTIGGIIGTTTGLVPAVVGVIAPQPEPQSSNRICDACNNIDSASTFGILASTYTNTGMGTSIDGNLAYTTAPAQNPTVSGMVVTPTAPTGLYAEAGRDQAAVLASLNLLPCMYNFSGATDLSTVDGGNLRSGIYCIAASASVGTAGIRFLDEGELYLFRIQGVLTTVTGSPMTITTSTSACNIFWTPRAATTLAANSAFVGTLIDSAGVTTGAHVEYTGRILAFGGTVVTDQATITVPCFA